MRTSAILIFNSIVIFFVLEGASSIVFYQLTKPDRYVFSSTVEALNRAVNGELINALRRQRYSKLNEVKMAKQEGLDAYPSYLHEPQLHHPSDHYYLGNAANKLIIGCSEAGFFNRWKSDRFGFRNPTGLHDRKVDLLLLGDSFAEGACENEEGTIAGYLRSRGLAVANLGKSGSGPLHQLATIKEYGEAYRPKDVIWIVFTGNDLQNLREEKTTLLGSYVDPDFTQNLLPRYRHVNEQLLKFLDLEYVNNMARQSRDLKLNANIGYGESLDTLDAETKEQSLLNEVAIRMHEEVTELGAKLRIVIINHKDYDVKMQRAAAGVVRDFAAVNDVQYLEYTREYFLKNQDLYTQKGPHFSAEGYLAVGEQIQAWLVTSDSKVL